ncbi:MAG: hypothetical protein IPF98_09390 [Gemmatimonadetes bacterium]|nr:hypothetical protein [Gemmatimonadota bacterium]
MTTPEPSDSFPAASEPTRSAAARAPGGIERRRNPRLRELIDEMLVTVRVAVNRDLWTPEERARAEEDMSVIMRRIRENAIASPH